MVAILGTVGLAGFCSATVDLGVFLQSQSPDGRMVEINGGIGNDTNRVTFLLAALTYAFGNDVRADFVPLNFPVNDALFNQLMGLWGGGAKPTNPGGPDGANAAMVLYQTTPNPAAGASEITYWLASETEISLALYDVAGREVGLIDHGVRPAGLNRSELKASDLSPGIYVLRLSALGQHRVRKVALIR